MEKTCFRKNRVELAVGGVFLLFFYTVVYSDILITVQNSLNLWDFLFQGRLGDFYTQSYGAVVNLGFDTGDWVFYDFPIYVVFALWNFPLWLLSRLGGLEILYFPPCVMWAKSMLLVFLWLAVRGLAGIGRAMGLDEPQRRLGCRLFLTSTLTISALCVLSQYDIIGISLMLWGIKAYMEGDTKRFLLFFALSVPMKLFTLMAFLPLILLREKRVERIAGQLACGVSLLLVCRLVFSASTGGDGLIWFLFKNTLQVSVGSLYLFAFAMAVLMIVCYIKPCRADLVQNEWAIYCCLAAYGIFFATSYTYPYWTIFMAPFLSLLMAKNSRFLRVNLLLDLVLSGGIQLAYIFEFPWCFGGADCSSMLLNFVQGGQKLGMSWDTQAVLTTLFPGRENAAEYAIGLGISAFWAALLIFLVVNLPALSRRLPLLASEPQKPERLFWALRLLAGYGLCCVPVAFYLMSFIL